MLRFVEAVAQKTIATTKTIILPVTVIMKTVLEIRVVVTLTITIIIIVSVKFYQSMIKTSNYLKIILILMELMKMQIKDQSYPNKMSRRSHNLTYKNNFRILKDTTNKRS